MSDDNEINNDDKEKDARELERRRRRQIALAADYPVGYAKPDPAHQFKAGNQMGAKPRRPKQPPSHDEIIRQIGEEKIIVNRNGLKIKISRTKFMYTDLMNDAVKGDWKSRKYVLDEIKRIKSASSDLLREVDHQSGADYVRRRLEAMAKRVEEEKLAEIERERHDDVFKKGEK